MCRQFELVHHVSAKQMTLLNGSWWVNKKFPSNVDIFLSDLSIYLFKHSIEDFGLQSIIICTVNYLYLRRRPSSWFESSHYLLFSEFDYLAISSDLTHSFYSEFSVISSTNTDDRSSGYRSSSSPSIQSEELYVNESAIGSMEDSASNPR